MGSPKYILYIGNLQRGGTCFDRFLALKRIGLHVMPFDTNKYNHIGNRITSSLMSRLNWGWPIKRLNNDLVNHCRRLPNLDLIWVDKGQWIKPETLQVMRSRTGAKLVHFTPDAALVYKKSRHFEQSISTYDLLVTTKRFELDLYKQKGARKVVLVKNACDETRFFPRSDAKHYLSDVCFIGRFEICRARYLKSLTTAENRMTIRVNGPLWPRYARFTRWMRHVNFGGPLWGKDYIKALCSAEIGLCFLTKYFPEQSTQRTFEIPFCGVFMLAERTNEHLELFEEGKEAEFFGSVEELIDKTKFYIKHPHVRNRVARLGRKRCIKSNYSLNCMISRLITMVYDD